MFTASNTIYRAMNYYVSHRVKRKRQKMFVCGKKKNRYYCGDRHLYRTEYLKSEHWKLLRSQKLKLNPTCEECGTSKNVEPHHLNYKNLYDVTPADLKTLCRKCHTLKHVDHSRVEHNKQRKRTIQRLIRKTARMGNIDTSIVAQYVLKHNFFCCK